MILMGSVQMASPSRGSGILSPVENVYMAVVSAIPLPQLKIWANAYFHPVVAYNQNKKDANFGAIAVHLILIALLAWVASELQAAVEPNFLAFNARLLGIISNPIMVLIVGFISSAICWIIAKIFGGRGGYMEQTLALALIYGGYTVVAFPFAVLGGGIGFALGAIAALIALYNLYLMTKAVHSLSSGRAAIVALMSIVVFVYVMVWFFVLYLMIFPPATFSLGGPGP